jgi:hypothetical protein
MVYVKILGIILLSAIVAGVIGCIGGIVLGCVITGCGKVDWGIKNFYNYFILFCMIAGVVVGIIYAIATYVQKYLREDKKKKEDEERKLREAREKYASEFKYKKDNIIIQCRHSNLLNSDNTVPNPNYDGILLQEKLWKALNETSIPLQKLEDVVTELNSVTKDEKSVYESVKNTEDLIVELLEKALAKKEIEDKRNKNTEKALEEHKQKLAAAEKLAQENINRLEEIEKSIHEQLIDCMAIVGEYKHTLDDILATAKGIGDHFRNDITLEEKNDWEKQLDLVLAESNAESEQLKQVVASHSAFRECSEMVNKQKAIISEVNKNIDDIKAIQQQIQDFVRSIENIEESYAKARESLSNDNYELAKELITQVRFDEIVKQAFEER